MMFELGHHLLTAMLTASAMMGMVGALTFLLIRGISIHSWRLRSCLAAAVLLQGVMIVRTPIHLGWIQTPSSAVRLPNLQDRSARGALDRELAVRSNHIAAGDSFVAASQATTRPAAARRMVQRIGWSTVLIAIWLTVIVAIMSVAIYRYVRLIRQIRNLASAPADWQRPWKSLVRRSPLVTDARCCEMLMSQTAGPMIVRDIRRYWLIVPEGYWRRLNEDQRRAVMLHELAHLERRDVWRQLAVRAIAIIHWINPIAWWAVREYEQAAEQACDQRVVAAGQRVATGFASALVELVQWDERLRQLHPAQSFPAGDNRRLTHGIGVQAMATPPLTSRISRLLQPNQTRDAVMKTFCLAIFMLALIFASFFQVRLTTAQNNSLGGNRELAELQVIAEQLDVQLGQIASQLDVADQTTGRLGELLATPTGKIAIAGFLDGLADQSREHAKSEALPRFTEHYFARNDDGLLVIRPEHVDAKKRWQTKSARLATSITQISETTKQIASQLDTSTEAGALFKRLMQDPQAPTAILMNELDGADIVGRYLSKAFQDLFVNRSDGSLVVVQSRRNEIEERLQTIERADQLRDRLARELPLLAAEYVDSDDAHAKLVRYLKNPTMAIVAAIMLAKDTDATIPAAVDQLHEHFEEISSDTAAGLQITDQDAWSQLEQIFARVDHASTLMPRVKDELTQTARTLATDDTLTARMAEYMQGDTLAFMLSADLPSPDVNVGDELRALLTEVASESAGKLVINPDREEAVTQKARELLQICRRIRRYQVDIDQMLSEISDRKFVQDLGDAGRYAMLDEVRRFAEAHNPDPIKLFQDNLLNRNTVGQWTVREDRRDVVRELIVQSERVAAEAGNDDF